VKLAVVAVGHRMPAWVDAGFADYARRLPRECALELKEIRPEPRSSGKTAAQLAAAEAVRIRAAVPRGAVRVALDERGRALTTAQLAAQLGRWRDEGRDAAFIVGGPDGLDPAVRQGADLVLALSALTLPHALARVVLAEQLYRAFSILHNHPYHRE
jgi:23S rRNA (pseudouridine1915-N3)-methyltransferase